MSKAEDPFIKMSQKTPGITPGKMFGALCMKLANGKSAAMFWKDNIVVKLNSENFKKALNLAGTQHFEPMEGRSMKEWIQIPYIYKDK